MTGSSSSSDFTQHDSLQVHRCCYKRHYFTLFSGWVVFHCMYVSYLLYPFIWWRTFMLFPCLGYCEQCCNEHWGTCIFLNYSLVQTYAQEGDCRINIAALFWFFSWGTSKLSSIVVASIYIPTNKMSVPFSPRPLQRWFVDFLIVAILTTVWWYLTVVWVSISLKIIDTEYLFLGLLAIYTSSLVGYNFVTKQQQHLGLLPICRWGSLFSCYWVVWAVCIFWKLSPGHGIICIYFLPVHRLSLHFVYGFLCCIKTCKFD